MTQPALALDQKSSLIEEHLSQVHRVVRHLIRIFNLRDDEYDEYYSSGLLGLVEAAGKYDPSKGIAFSAFAFFRIKGAILDSIRKNSSISPHHYRQIQILGGIDKIRDLFQNPLLAEDLPKNDKLAAALEYVMQGALLFRLTLDEPTVDKEERFHDENTPENVLLRNANHSALRKIIADLPEVERRVIEGYYFKGRSFSEIAQDDPPLSKSWISRIHNKALNRIRDAYLLYSPHLKIPEPEAPRAGSIPQPATSSAESRDNTDPPPESDKARSGSFHEKCRCSSGKAFSCAGGIELTQENTI